ncbi:MAG: phenylalanine--tRNA ligase subunit alpha [Mycoplasma sp.]
MKDYQALLSQFSNELTNIKTATEAIIAKNKFVNTHLAPLYNELKTVSKDQKAKFGAEINQFKNQINTLFDRFYTELENRILNQDHETKADLNIDSVIINKGALNPLTLMANEIISFFRQLDFQIETGNEVTKVAYNFDYLNIPLDHPGRQTSETFYFNQDLMLRAHNTAVTAELMHQNNKSKDLRILTYGNVYRNDDDDLSHSHQFNQIDLVWVKEGLSVSNLKWLINSLLQHLYGNDVEVRYRLSYFPFTEPSMEVDVRCPSCHGKGCSLCKKSGWLEILGAGMLHKKVLSDAGFEINTAIAAGIGIDRLAMIKYKISDIRQLYTNDFKFLTQFAKENR